MQTKVWIKKQYFLDKICSNFTFPLYFPLVCYLRHKNMFSTKFKKITAILLKRTFYENSKMAAKMVDMFLNDWTYSWTSIIRSLKGNEKYFEWARFRIIGDQ